jgi:glutamate-1-semialdehyde 2,1-aminomutase
MKAVGVGPAYSDPVLGDVKAGGPAAAAGLPLGAGHVGSMFGSFFQAGPVTDYPSARRSDTARFARWFWAMIARGVYLAPSQFEAGFVSLAHGDAEIEETVEAARVVMAGLAGD